MEFIQSKISSGLFVFGIVDYRPLGCLPSSINKKTFVSTHFVTSCFLFGGMAELIPTSPEPNNHKSF